MSFILDALKKSELERQRQSMPGLVESGIARPRPRLPLWAIALCALLAINLIVLLVVLARGWLTSPVQTPAAPVVSTPSTVAPTAADKTFSPLDAAPIYAPEVPVTAANDAATEPPVALRPPESGSSGTRAIRRRDPLLQDNDYKADDDEVLPSINELNLTGSDALPELHLDVHVFATKSAERFVFVNMRKYHEGATLQEGPTIERIRRDGVILNYHGVRFLLPRQ